MKSVVGGNAKETRRYAALLLYPLHGGERSDDEHRRSA